MITQELVAISDGGCSSQEPSGGTPAALFNTRKSTRSPILQWWFHLKEIKLGHRSHGAWWLTFCYFLRDKILVYFYELHFSV